MYKVIIVEDEYIVRTGIRMVVDWSKIGMEVAAEASNGEQAYALYLSEHPDIIITDIKMPVMDGMELIRKIRETDQDTRIIILSNLDEFEMIRQAISLNVSDYFLKLTMTNNEMEDVLIKVRRELEVIQKSKTIRHVKSEEQEIGTMILKHLFYHVANLDEISVRLKQLSGDSSYKHVALCVMELANYEEIQQVFSDKYGDLVYTAFSNIALELMQEHGQGLVLHEKDDRYILIMDLGREPDGQKAKDLFLTILDTISKVLFTHFSSCITFGVSRIAPLDELGSLYSQALQAVGYRFFVGQGKQILFDEIPQIKLLKFIEKKLTGLAHSKDLMGIFINEFLKEETAESCEKALVSMFRYLTNMQISEMALDPNQRYSILQQYETQVLASRTLDELCEVYQNSLSLSGADGAKKNVMHSTVIQVVNFINRHFSENLSLEQIADAVGLSKNYLCGLFKKEMGVNLIYYIMVYRIEKAKELILTTSMKSYEIAQDVGFSDESYFSRSFKKVTGKSPNEFKREAHFVER